LDHHRYWALTSNIKHKRKFSDIFKVGVKGYLFSMLGEFAERKLGEYTGSPPGSEMLTAINIAKERKIKISLIDQDISITLKKLSKNITFREKGRFLIELISAPFKKKKIAFDLNKVPSEKVIKILMNEVKKKYPNVYKVLIVERNEIMANNLYKIMRNYENSQILAVMGAGHEKEIISMIKDKWPAAK
ncbi:MAG: TraB/GumN family protein, partial [Nanoarchaeota archaeon]|nr:TraB/GumN family protein [Nanoarchaeota archaeon]